MRTIVNYFRSMFCNHKFEYQERFSERSDDFRTKKGIRVSRTCTECGWHKNYWKF